MFFPLSPAQAPECCFLSLCLKFYHKMQNSEHGGASQKI